MFIILALALIFFCMTPCPANTTEIDAQIQKIYEKLQTEQKSNDPNYNSIIQELNNVIDSYNGKENKSIYVTYQLLYSLYKLTGDEIKGREVLYRYCNKYAYSEYAYAARDRLINEEPNRKRIKEMESNLLDLYYKESNSTHALFIARSLFRIYGWSGNFDNYCYKMIKTIYTDYINRFGKPKDNSSFLYSYSCSLNNNLKFNEATVAMEEMFIIYPKELHNIDYMIFYANMVRSSGDNIKSLQILDELENEDTNNSQKIRCLKAKSDAFREMGDIAQAKIMLETALVIANDNKDANQIRSIKKLLQSGDFTRHIAENKVKRPSFKRIFISVMFPVLLLGIIIYKFRKKLYAKAIFMARYKSLIFIIIIVLMNCKVSANNQSTILENEVKYTKLHISNITPLKLADKLEGSIVKNKHVDNINILSEGYYYLGILSISGGRIEKGKDSLRIVIEKYPKTKYSNILSPYKYIFNKSTIDFKGTEKVLMDLYTKEKNEDIAALLCIMIIDSYGYNTNYNNNVIFMYNNYVKHFGIPKYNWHLLYSVASTQFKKKQFDNSRKTLENMFRLYKHTDNEFYHLLLYSNALIECDKTKQAKKFLTTNIKKYKYDYVLNIERMRTYSYALYKENKYNEAIAILQNALSYANENKNQYIVNELQTDIQDIKSRKFRGIFK